MSSRQLWLPQVESDLPFCVDFLLKSKLRYWSLIFRVLAGWGSACIKKLQEAGRGKLWLLAVLSGVLEPFGVKIVCGRPFSRTGLSLETLWD